MSWACRAHSEGDCCEVQPGVTRWPWLHHGRPRRRREFATKLGRPTLQMAGAERVRTAAATINAEANAHIDVAARTADLTQVGIDLVSASP